MKKWKINVGIMVVISVLSMVLLFGKTENVISSSAEELVYGGNVGTEDYTKKVESVDIKEIYINEEEKDTDKSDTNVCELEENTCDSEENTIESEVSAYNAVASTSKEIECTDESKVSTIEIQESSIKSEVNTNESEEYTKANTLDEAAYVENVQEEEYIVNLVNKATSDDLTTADWKQCLAYLRDNYNSLISSPNVDREKVESYVNGYSLVEVGENLPSEIVNSGVITTKAYSASKVTAYTNKWWNSHNPKYPNFDGKGGDCANFVSQALAAGGKAMKGTDATNFANWFCRSTSNLKQISSTWRGADAFGHYWRANAKGYKEFDGDKYFKDRASFEAIYKYTSVGDAISFLNSNGRPYHTVIVSYKNRKTEEKPQGNNMINFASHTASHKWRSVYDYLKGTGTDIRVYDMY